MIPILYTFPILYTQHSQLWLLSSQRQINVHPHLFFSSIFEYDSFTYTILIDKILLLYSLLSHISFNPCTTFIFYLTNYWNLDFNFKNDYKPKIKNKETKINDKNKLNINLQEEPNLPKIGKSIESISHVEWKRKKLSIHQLEHIFV